MKLSLNWIKDFVEIPKKIELSKLVYDLTMSTVEVENAHSLQDGFANMAVGIVREIQPHPDADKLVLCRVDLGEDGLREIVCGGINLTEGMKVAVACPGAIVRWHGEGDPVELKKTKVRGVESYGMICSSSEIGLFDLFPYTEEATIIDLSSFGAAPGTPLAEALGLDDVILTIDNKSLTNRPDLWGHYGMAREIAAIYDLPLKVIPGENSLETPVEFAAVYDLPLKVISDGVTAVPPGSGFKMTIEDPQLCPRYIGVKIEGVSLKPAPFEIQSRIWRVGMRPINALVDITNYIMLVTGQPTHAFDADAVTGNITIRRAKKNEKLVLLGGRELTLTTEDQVIADEKEAIALAGVMGGEKDSVLPGTRNVILEIANFNALTVRRTAMRHDVRTEAATRYEKNIDPQRADLALTEAVRLFTNIYPGMKITGFHDNYPQPLHRGEIHVSLGWLERRLGRKMSPDHLFSLLERLGFEVNFTGDDMQILVPSWRSTGDVSLPDDIMEEIARIHGLENFEQTPIVTAFTQAINQPGIDIDRKIREHLAQSCGMNEVCTYPWVSEEYIAATLGADQLGKGMLEMSSPPSPNERYLRKSLIPGLCKAVADNLRYFSRFAVFESAQVFFDEGYTSPYDKRESLPLQRRHVAGAFAAPREQYTEAFRHAKGALESMPGQIHIQPLNLTQNESSHDGTPQYAKPYWADDVIWQTVTHCGKEAGVLGLLSQKSALACGIKNAAVMLFELDIDALEPLPSRENSYRRIPEYPETQYDISLLFDTQTKWEDIKKTASGKESPGNLLRAVSFVDEYKGHQIPEGKKSVTLSLTIGSPEKTLTSEEIESCAAAVTKRLCKTLAAEPRGYQKVL